MSALPKVTAALQAGADAAKAGQPLTANPWRASAQDVDERIQAKMWFRGYDRHKPLAVDFTGDPAAAK